MHGVDHLTGDGDLHAEVSPAEDAEAFERRGEKAERRGDAADLPVCGRLEIVLIESRSDVWPASDDEAVRVRHAAAGLQRERANEHRQRADH